MVYLSLKNTHRPSCTPADVLGGFPADLETPMGQNEQPLWEGSSGLLSCHPLSGGHSCLDLLSSIFLPHLLSPLVASLLLL